VVSPTKQRSVADVCHRLRWDLALSPYKDHFGIGYEDNYKGSWTALWWFCSSASPSHLIVTNRCIDSFISVIDVPFRDFKWDEVSTNTIKVSVVTTWNTYNYNTITTISVTSRRWELAAHQSPDDTTTNPYLNTELTSSSLSSIQYVRYYDRVVWDKKHRLDHFFGSSAPSVSLNTQTHRITDANI